MISKQADCCYYLEWISQKDSIQKSKSSQNSRTWTDVELGQVWYSWGASVSWMKNSRHEIDWEIKFGHHNFATLWWEKQKVSKKPDPSVSDDDWNELFHDWTWMLKCCLFQYTVFQKESYPLNN